MTKTIGYVKIKKEDSMYFVEMMDRSGSSEEAKAYSLDIAKFIVQLFLRRLEKEELDRRMKDGKTNSSL